VELLRLGVDLRDADDPGSWLTLRRLWIAYKAFPQPNMVDVALSRMPAEARWWTADTYVLANLFDAVQSLTHVTQLINTPKGKPKPKAPKPHPRPKPKPKLGRAGFRDLMRGRVRYVGGGDGGAGGGQGLCGPGAEGA
jgi:hypothetical protein